MAVLELKEAHASWLDTGREWALFLDIDGTLLELRNRPGMVVAGVELIELITQLVATFAGAVAVISGRAIADIDRIFSPLELTCAGVHGAQVRAGGELIAPPPQDPGFLARARERLEGFTAQHPGTLVEDKGISLALHTRLAPDSYPQAEALLDAIAAESAGRYAMLRGKCVHELIPTGVGKGSALARLMATAPFKDRAPAMIGDDVTDASAFRMAQALGGCAIGVGAESPPADHRLASPHDCRRWLRELVAARTRR